MFEAIMLTACALCALSSGACLWRTIALTDRAEHAANRLLRSQGKIAALETQCEDFTARWRKINGRLSSVEGVIHDALDEAEDDPRPDDYPPAVSRSDIAVCDNWARGCDEGPLSAAARCPCGYCETQREQRRRQRLAAVPTTVRAQGELAKLNAVKP